MLNRTNKSIVKITFSMLMSFVISASFLISGFAAAPQSEYYDLTNEYHEEVDFKELSYSTFDPTTLDRELDHLEEIIHSSGSEEDFIKAYKAIQHEIELLSTTYSLVMNHNYSNPSDEESAAYLIDLREIDMLATDRLFSLLHDAYLTSYHSAVTEVIKSEKILKEVEEYEEMTEEQKQLTLEESNLVNDFLNQSSKEVSVTIDGTEWTFESLFMDSNLSEQEYLDIYVALSKEKNQHLASIYADLVKVRMKIAEENDYDNYAEFMDEKMYYRDYSSEDISKLYGYVKEYLVPLRDRLNELTSAAGSIPSKTDINNYNLNEDELVALVEPYIREVHPDLGISFDYMKRNHTFDMVNDPGRIDVGYTSTLASYNMPYIYNKMSGSYYDIKTLIHEFGHYNAAYHKNINSPFSPMIVDVAEIHSQGLELLTMNRNSDIYGSDVAVYINTILISNLVTNIIDGCIFDEFQRAVYSSDKELTVSEINHLYRITAEDYSITFLTDDDQAYSWTDVTHTFETPLYYLGYAVSALSAFDIWSMSMNNHDKAIDCYMNITTRLDDSYCKATGDAGLRNIFEETTLKEISEEINSYLDAQEAIIQKQLQIEQMKLIFAGVIAILIIIIIAFVVYRNYKLLKKNKQENTQEL